MVLCYIVWALESWGLVGENPKCLNGRRNFFLADQMYDAIIVDSNVDSCTGVLKKARLFELVAPFISCAGWQRHIEID